MKCKWRQNGLCIPNNTVLSAGTVQQAFGNQTTNFQKKAGQTCFKELSETDEQMQYRPHVGSILYIYHRKFITGLGTGY